MSAGLQCWQHFKSLTPAFRLIERCDRQLSHNTALITKTHRDTYIRQYPVTLVHPDGSSYTIRYHEPRLLIKLPLDVSTLSEKELKIVLEKRRPKKKVEYAKEEDESFQATKYLQFVKRKKK